MPDPKGGRLDGSSPTGQAAELHAASPAPLDEWEWSGIYAAAPGSGPSRETCGSCAHLAFVVMGVRRRKDCPKCGLRASWWIGGEQTDVDRRSPACERWRENR